MAGQFHAPSHPGVLKKLNMNGNILQNLLIRISRGANNCGQHSLEKNSYFTMRFSPHFQLFYFSDRLEFCEFFEWKIKRINNADLFSQPPLLIFIKGANISGGHCILFFCVCLCVRAKKTSGTINLFYFQRKQNIHAVTCCAHNSHQSISEVLWPPREKCCYGWVILRACYIARKQEVQIVKKKKKSIFSASVSMHQLNFVVFYNIDFTCIS